MSLAFRLLAIFLLSVQFSIAQKNDVDSLENLIRNTASDTTKVKLMNTLVTRLRDRDNNRAFEYAEEAIKLAELLNYKKGLGLALENLGWIEYRRGDYSHAFEKQTHALRISQELNDEAAIARCWIGIAAINYEQKQFEKAIQYVSKAYAVGKKINDYAIQARSLNNISFAYLELNQLDSAERYALRCREITGRHTNLYIDGFALRTLGDVALHKKNYALAMSRYSEAADIANKEKNIFLQASTGHRLAKAYLLTGQLEKARYVAEKNSVIAKRDSYLDDLEKTYEVLSKIAYVQHNVNEAYQYQSKYIELHDSLFNTRNSEYMALIQTRFDSEIKQAQIELLTKDTELQEEAFKQQKVWTYFFIGCLSLVFIVLVIFLYTNRLIRKAYRQLKLKNAEIYRQSQQLRNLNTTKDKLFSIIGHDLRSPVASLKGLMEIISLDNLTREEFSGVTQSLKRNLDSVYEDLDNLLMWAQSQLKGIHAVPEVVYLNKVVEEKLNMFTEAARVKEITLINEVKGDVTVWADVNQVKLIFRNLLNNAIKFNRVGGLIKVSVTESHEHIEISVVDSGVGINSGDMLKLFNAETHFTKLGTQKEKGSGLGLLLTKEFVECNGGTITVTSDMGKGSTFTFTLKRVFAEIKKEEGALRSSF